MLTVADDFASPAAEGAAYLSGAGWFSSARELDLWQMDFSVQANALFIPESKRNISVSGNKYTTFGIRGSESAEIPTAFGGNTEVDFEGQIFGEDFSFDAIDGVDKKMLMHPFVQASVGLPSGTDLTVRFLPETSIDDVGFSTYGVGLKHNFNQYLSNSRPSDFQFAALLAYSKYNVNYRFTPVEIKYELAGMTRSVVKMEDIDVDANLWLFQLISSKTFFNSNWEIFGAFGLTTSNFGYVVGGGGDFLPQMNAALETLNKSEIEIKGDLGFNYKAGNFMLSSMLSAGKFINYNIGLHYRL